ncbi:uncharacterized protein M6B38_200440 [Iris pallida]|uniref:Uncharacterized protein n=1 Tax=Iris pallida TaxID=29817 RepID=A0AAX6EAI7_IRIPA|nr:Uncharacterized protein M6B38_233105 [Iris pallida]KAJ6800950.1 uncharacterized protein M6B38_200440 [Iris pallida]
MASRAVSYWRSVVNRVGAGRQFATWTTPKMKPMSTAADVAHAQHGDSHTRRMKQKGDFVPVYVALGLILMSVGLGLHTMKHHIAYDPAVRVSKKRRETIPEVVEPDRVVDEADRYVNKSLFRKVGHIQDIDSIRSGMGDPTRPDDPFDHRRQVETLKSVGVDPASL